MIKQHIVIGLLKSQPEHQFSPAVRYLFLQRRDGTWTFPGGKVEDGEKPEDAVLREIKQESDIRVRIVRKLGIVEKADQVLHYYICEACEAVNGRFKNKEPEKFSRGDWCSPQELIQKFDNTASLLVRQYLGSLSPKLTQIYRI